MRLDFTAVCGTGPSSDKDSGDPTWQWRIPPQPAASTPTHSIYPPHSPHPTEQQGLYSKYKVDHCYISPLSISTFHFYGKMGDDISKLKEGEVGGSNQKSPFSFRWGIQHQSSSEVHSGKAICRAEIMLRQQ